MRHEKQSVVAYYHRLIASAETKSSQLGIEITGQVSSEIYLSHNSTCRAVTEAGSDRETPEPSKNMVELLAPFLAPYPADAAAKGADLAAELEPKSSSISGSLSAAEEQQSVHEFVKQQHGNGGLYQVAAAALERVLLGNLPAKQVSDLTQELIKLESVVTGKLDASYPTCCWPVQTHLACVLRM